MHCLRLTGPYLQHHHLVSKMLVILFPNYVHYYSHFDGESCPLVALFGMIVMLLDSSVSFFLKINFVDGYLYIFCNVD